MQFAKGKHLIRIILRSTALILFKIILNFNLNLDWTLTVTNTSGQSGHGSNDNEGVVRNSPELLNLILGTEYN